MCMAFYIGEIMKLRREFQEAHQNGEYMEAIALGKKIYDLYRENNDCNTMEYAIDVNNLAIAFDDVCMYEKAQKYYKEAANLKREIGGECSSYSDTLNNLAITYSNMAKYQDAVTLQKQVLEIRDRLLGRGHEDYVASLYNLGNAYEDIKEYDKAIEMHNKALLKGQRLNTVSKMDLADILTSLGRSYEKQGNYKKAEKVLKRALDILKVERGEESHYYMMNLLRMATVCERAGLLDKATSYCEKAMKIRKKVVAESQLEYITNLNSLAALYTKKEDFSRSLEIHQRVQSIVKNLLGEHHTFYAECLNHMAMDYCGLKDYAKALQYNDMALDLKKQLMGEKHGQYVLSLLSKGTILDKKGDYEEALQCYQKALDMRNELYQGKSIACADTLLAMARVYLHKGEMEQAESCLLQSRTLRRELKETEDVAYVLNLEMLAELYYNKEQLKNGITCCKEALEIQKKLFGENHPSYARVLAHLGKLYATIGDKENALKTLQKVVEIEEETLGEENIRYKMSMEILARVAYQNGVYELSMSCWEKLDNMNFEESAEKRFASAKLELWMASCCLQMENPSKAKAYYEKAMEKKESCGIEADQEWGLMIKTFLLTLARKNQEKLHKERIKKEEQKNDFGEEEQSFLSFYEERVEKFGEQDTQALQCCIDLGDFYGGAGKYDKAFFWLEKAEKQGEGHIYEEALRKIGILYLLTRKYDKAFEKLTCAVRYQEEYGSTEGEEYCILMGLMGDFYFALKELENALYHYEIWYQLFPGKIIKNQLYLERVQRMGKMAERLKKKGQASSYYKEAADYIRQQQGSSLDLAKVLLKSGELLLKLDKDDEEGKENIKKAIEIFGKEKGKESRAYGKLMSKLGVLYLSLDKIEEGIAFLEQSYQIQCSYEQAKILSKKGYDMLLKYLKEEKNNTKYQLVKKGKPLY